MDDLIKREDVIKAVGGTRCVDDIDEEIYAIPSADTEIEIIKAEAYAKGIDSERKRISDWCRPRGEWIWQLADNGWADHICSVCGYTKNTDIHVSLNWSYCPHCGSKMRGEHDD